HVRFPGPGAWPRPAVHGLAAGAADPGSQPARRVGHQHSSGRNEHPGTDAELCAAHRGRGYRDRGHHVVGHAIGREFHDADILASLGGNPVIAAWAVAFSLILARVATFITLMPIFGGTQVPRLVKAG